MPKKAKKETEEKKLASTEEKEQEVKIDDADLSMDNKEKKTTELENKRLKEAEAKLQDDSQEKVVTEDTPKAAVSDSESVPDKKSLSDFSSELVVEEASSASKGKTIKKLLIVVVVVAAIVALVTGGILVYRKSMEGQSEGQEMTTPSSTVSETEPTPTPEPEKPELNREDLQVQVLNGTGEPGAAGEGQEYLEGLGYQGVAVGNAGAYDYSETEISLKADKMDFADLLSEDLSGKYTVADSIETLDEDSEYDAVVILGEVGSSSEE